MRSDLISAAAADPDCFTCGEMAFCYPPVCGIKSAGFPSTRALFSANWQLFLVHQIFVVVKCDEST
jgi:hypothetical protein